MTDLGVTMRGLPAAAAAAWGAGWRWEVTREDFDLGEDKAEEAAERAF